jgi:ABC-type oligopeptide transport system substrate-binding subunit
MFTKWPRSVACLMAGAASASAATTTTAQVAPITMNVDSLPLSLEPSKVTDIISNWLLYHLGQRLIETNASGTIRGDLAERWEVVGEGKEFRFDLKKNATFSDGTALTSTQVKESVERALKSKANFSFYLENVEKVSVDGPARVVFTLKQPMPGFLQILGEPMFTITKPCGSSLCFSGQCVLSDRKEKFIDLRRVRDGQVFRFKEMPFGDALRDFNSGKLDILRSYGAGNVKMTLDAAPKSSIQFDDAKSYFVALNGKSRYFSKRE